MTSTGHPRAARRRYLTAAVVAGAGLVRKWTGFRFERGKRWPHK
jgi:hypothetical protein